MLHATGTHARICSRPLVLANRRIGGSGTIAWGRAGCYNNITVSGAEGLQPTRMGAYVRVAGLMQGGRVVYQHASSAATFIFYWPSSSNWLIGSSYTSISASVSSTDGTGALCPDLATGWEVLASSIWLPSAIVVAPVPGQTLPPTLATRLTPGPTTRTPTALPTWNVADPSGNGDSRVGPAPCTHKRDAQTDAHARSPDPASDSCTQAHTHARARTHSLTHTQQQRQHTWHG